MRLVVPVLVILSSAALAGLQRLRHQLQRVGRQFRRIGCGERLREYLEGHGDRRRVPAQLADSGGGKCHGGGH